MSTPERTRQAEQRALLDQPCAVYDKDGAALTPAEVLVARPQTPPPRVP